ncbi:hypothetical protein B0O80DRAFT_431749 [Mortierella sp. GBAus27b]|nr:hypothetical protein B0O80DRAFT_431749 [Mortierella sp. GBAus27b]
MTRIPSHPPLLLALSCHPLAHPTLASSSAINPSASIALLALHRYLFTATGYTMYMYCHHTGNPPQLAQHLPLPPPTLTIATSDKAQAAITSTQPNRHSQRI